MQLARGLGFDQIVKKQQLDDAALKLGKFKHRLVQIGVLIRVCGEKPTGVILRNSFICTGKIVIVRDHSMKTAIIRPLLPMLIVDLIVHATENKRSLLAASYSLVI